MFSPKDLPKKVIRGLEEHVMGIQRELDEGRSEKYERIDLWLEPKAYKKKLFDEKHIIKAFVVGVLTAQVWKDDFFVMPEGFAKTVENVSRSVQLLRFADPRQGRIRMSMNEIIDKHMRLWIQQDENCQKWIRDKTLDPKCILRAACDVLIYERRVFERDFNGTLQEAKAQIAKEMLTEQAEIEIEKPKEEQKPPSGLRPAVP